MIAAELVGVLEVGGPRGSGVPASGHQPLRLSQGADNVVRLRVVESSGADVPAASGDVVRLTVRKVTGQPPAIVTAGAPAPMRGSCEWDFTLPAGAMRVVASGSYVFDVTRVTQAGAVDALVPTSPCFVEPSAFSKP